MSILKAIDKSELAALTAPADLRAWQIALENFALIAAAFALPAFWHNPLAWLIASVVLGGRALALGVLTHDTAHASFFKSKKLNEWAGTWLFGALPNVPYAIYRKGHLEHHRTAGTVKDPDLAFVDGYPATRASLLRKFTRDLSGLNGVKNIVFQIQSFRLRSGMPFLVSHALLFGALYALGVPQVYVCWWIGQVFFFPLFVRLRVMGEHGGVAEPFSRDPRQHTGTTLPGPLGRLLISPNFVNYHVEHHLAAAVPPYKLRRLHRLLAARGYYDGMDCVANSYWAVIRRCTKDGPDRQRELSGNGRRGIMDNMR